MDEQQRLNYLHWMKERGQAYLVPASFLAPRSAPLTPDVVAASETIPSPELPALEPALASPQAPAPSPDREPTLNGKVPERKAEEAEKPWLGVVFYSETALNPAEHEMVTRIATALSLSAAEVLIAFGADGRAMIARQQQCRVIVMGGDGEALPARAEGQTVLLIPHPGAMLQEPQLKVSAWQTLQKLKATR